MNETVKKGTPGRKKGVEKTAGSGRKKGTPNIMTNNLRTIIMNALSKAGGEDYLVEQSKSNPTAFLQLVGKVIPAELKADISGGLTISWESDE
tara:strand:- start:41 stop:319 length:279 start_codon:yes stop_codon:yes gene_type:complete